MYVADLRKMSKGHVALLYLGIFVLASGCALFFGGMIYLSWLLIDQPTIIESDFSPHVIMRGS